MKFEDQRIAIAEACGWKGPYKKEWIDHGETWAFAGTDPEGERWALPYFVTDLSAIAKAEDTLTDVQLMLMYNHLEEICERAGKFPGGVDTRLATRVWRATAPQRAEAFLRTLDLWTENTRPA